MPLGMLRGGNSAFYLNTTGSRLQKVPLHGSAHLLQAVLVRSTIIVWFTKHLPCSHIYTFLKLCFNAPEAIGQEP